ncbi:hypothetical protein BH24ACI3_BH24ACI3_13190 [soil metagenome]
MSTTTTVVTVTKMLEGLPQSVQDRAVEHLRKYLDEITDELRWDKSFANPSEKLKDAARRAREQFKEGKTEPLDLGRL